MSRVQHGGVWPSRRELARTMEDAMLAVAAGRGSEPLLLCGPLGSGRRELVEWLLARARRDGLLVASCAPAAGDDQTVALLDSIAEAAEALVLRRPGSPAGQSLRKRVAGLRAAVTAGRAGPLELAPVIRLLCEATEEARAALVLVLVGLPGDGASRALLDVVQRGHDSSQPVLVVAACQVLGGATDGWHRHDLGPLELDDLADTTVALEPGAGRALLEATGGWPGLVRPVLERLASLAQRHAFDDEQVRAVAATTVRETVQSWVGALSAPERRYLRAVVDFAGPDGSTSLVDVGRALGDSTRFSTESSTLAGLRTALTERGALFSPGKDRLQPAIVGLAELLR